eukprot:gene6109-10116_t
MKRLSGLQLHVLTLYKQFLRVAKNKNNEQLTLHIKEQFRTDSLIPKTAIDKIEWKLRNGKFQLDTISNPNFEGFSIAN